MKDRYRLTPEIEQRILSFIRAGGFPWVAAEGAGIPRKVFRLWLRRGQKKGARKLYRRFYQSVIEARAQARLTAELETRKKDPRFWLVRGPGREQPDAPGWTNPVKPIEWQKASPEDFLMSRLFMNCVSRLMQALAAYPEARSAAAKLAEELVNEEKRQGRTRDEIAKDRTLKEEG
jgi:hypothetical protein